jgi:hypothetical protein
LVRDILAWAQAHQIVDSGEKNAMSENISRALWDGAAWKTPYRPNLTEEEKVPGLSRLWSEVKFNFANFDLAPALDWDRLYLAYLPKVRQTKSTLEYYRVLMELCAKLKDSHTNVYVPDELSDEAYSRPAIRTLLIEDRVFIWCVLDQKLKQNGIEPGLEIVEIGGVPVKRYAAQRVMPYQSASTPQDLAVRMFEYALLAGSAKEGVELSLGDGNGHTRKKTLPRLRKNARSSSPGRRHWSSSCCLATSVTSR